MNKLVYGFGVQSINHIKAINDEIIIGICLLEIHSPGKMNIMDISNSQPDCLLSQAFEVRRYKIPGNFM